MATINQSTSIECSPKELFLFLTKPANLISVSPSMPSLSFHAPKLLMGKGQIIHSTLSYGIFQINWKSKITQYEPYTFFEDAALDSPFTKWVHRRSFEKQGRKTLVQDEIKYDIGLGPLGRLVERLIIDYQIENFLKERQKKTTEKIRQIKRHSA